jgi:hypothetical protein
MKKNYAQLLLLVLVTLMALSACGLLQEPEEASSTIEAIPVSDAGRRRGSLPKPATTEAAEPTAAPVEPTDAPAEATPAPEPTVEAAAPTGTALVFTIDQGASQVRFQLDEELRGQPTTVVGTTDQVAGQLSVNLADLSQTQVGIIQINARTLATDNNFRNRAIQNEILNTGDFEFITFTPTALRGCRPAPRWARRSASVWWAI